MTDWSTFDAPALVPARKTGPATVRMVDLLPPDEVEVPKKPRAPPAARPAIPLEVLSAIILCKNIVRSAWQHKAPGGPTMDAVRRVEVWIQDREKKD